MASIIHTAEEDAALTLIKFNLSWSMTDTSILRFSLVKRGVLFIIKFNVFNICLLKLSNSTTNGADWPKIMLNSITYQIQIFWLMTITNNSYKYNSYSIYTLNTQIHKTYRKTALWSGFNITVKLTGRIKNRIISYIIISFHSRKKCQFWSRNWKIHANISFFKDH